MLMQIIDNNKQVVGERNISQIVPSRPRPLKKTAHITSYRTANHRADNKVTRQGTVIYNISEFNGLRALLAWPKGRTFSKEYGELVDVILTHCDIYPPLPVKPGGKLPYPFFPTENCMWDTGSDTTIISPRIAQLLGLKFEGYQKVDGIGEEKGTLHHCHLGLPDGTLLTGCEVTALPIAYDLIIGMDIMNQLDIAFSNKDEKSVFTYRLPSTEKIIFKD